MTPQGVTAETAVAPHRNVSRPLLVTARRSAAEGVVHLGLQAPGGEPLPAWEPGAHVDLVLGDGLVRPYSLCGDPARTDRWEVAVQLAPGGGRGGSRAVFQRLHPGTEVEVRGPRNAFALRPSPRYVFVAGGIGITPILPMLRRAEGDGADWSLAYGGRRREAMPFRDELARYGDRVRLFPQDETGLLPVAQLVGAPRPDTLVYCCGPAPLLDALGAAMRDWPPDRLVLERFAPRPTPAGAGDEGAFEVELARSGRAIAVAAGVSLLQALERAGVPVLSSCWEGTCGTCEVGVLAGQVDHRDRLLTAQERAAGDTMLPCVSRARGARLVLDL